MAVCSSLPVDVETAGGGTDLTQGSAMLWER